MYVIIDEDGQLLTNDDGNFHCDLSEAAKFKTLEEAERILTEILNQYREMSDSDAPEKCSWMSIIDMKVISDMDSLGLIHLDKNNRALRVKDVIVSDNGSLFTIDKIDVWGVSGDDYTHISWVSIRKCWSLQKKTRLNISYIS